MEIIINFLQADNGDCFLIIFKNDSKQITFLIDGGYKTRYRPNLERLLYGVYSNTQSENYIIVTHTDSDHIGGIQAFFEDKCSLKNKVKAVFFNTSLELKSFTPYASDCPKSIIIENTSQTNTSFEQGKSLEKLLDDLGIEVISNIIAKKEVLIGNIKIVFLSPRISTLNKYKTWLEQEEKRLMTASKTNDYSDDIELLYKNDYVEDNSVTNASSLSMLIEYYDKRMLFLGDALSSDVLQSLHELGYSSENKITVDLVKVSHHASKNNTSTELLNYILCEKFLISTNGATYGHPDKEVLSRIIYTQNNPELIFNYDICDRIFTKEERDRKIFNVSIKREIVI